MTTQHLIYALPDLHGRVDLLHKALSDIDLNRDAVVLLGDYIPHQTFTMPDDVWLEETVAILDEIRSLCISHENIITLMGNHEYDLLERVTFEHTSIPTRLVAWMHNLPLYYETNHHIFVHSGIDEASDTWQIETPDIMFLAKQPIDTGAFGKIIVAGHHASNDIRFDGQSHIYLDINAEFSGKLAMLRYDEDANIHHYRFVTDDSLGSWQPLRRKGF